MIISGGSRRGAAWFSTHFMRTDQGQRVAIAEARGLAGDSIPYWFQQMRAVATGTRCENFFYHANINPREGEELTEEEWTKAIDTLERNLGLDGHSRFVVEHDKNGRAPHRHVVWSRIDVDTMTAVSDSKTYRIHERTADELEKEFGHAPTPRGRGPDGPNPKNHEVFRGKRSGIDPYDVKDDLTRAWRTTDNGRAFAAAIGEQGYILARGDSRAFVVLDPAGDVYSVAKYVAGVRTKDVKARMTDLDIDALPSVDEARAMARGRAAERNERDDRQDARQPEPAHAGPPDRRRDATPYELLAEELVHAARDAPAPNTGPREEPEPAHADPPPPAIEAPGSEPSAFDAHIRAFFAHRQASAALAQEGHSAAEPPPMDAPGPEPSAFDAHIQAFFAHRQARGELAQQGHAAPEAQATETPLPEPTRFDRLAQELVQAAKDVAPIAEDIAVAAAVVAEPEGKTAEQELTAFERAVEILKQAGRGEATLAESLDWLGAKAGLPAHVARSAPQTPFERAAQEMKDAMRENGGEPEPGFWQRSVSLLASARDRALTWARTSAQTFAGLIRRNRNSDHDKSGFER